MTTPVGEQWAVVDTDAGEIVYPQILWRGPSGEGNLWTPNTDGTEYTSDADETSHAPEGHEQWVPPVAGKLALEAWARSQGYPVRQFGPPPAQDTDGDGVPDPYDAEPENPDVQ